MSALRDYLRWLLFVVVGLVLFYLGSRDLHGHNAQLFMVITIALVGALLLGFWLLRERGSEEAP